MSALEQIRKRPALIISILGLALLLFILTAISNPEKLFSDNTTVAKVDGKKIPYEEFRDISKKFSDMDEMRARQNNLPRTNNAIIEEQAMEYVIDRALLDKKLDKLGINVSDEEVIFAINNNHPIVFQYLQSYNIPTVYDFHDLAFNPENLGLSEEGAEFFKARWDEMKNEVRESLRDAKYNSFFGNTLRPTKAEALDYYNASMTVDTIRYVRVLTSAISDSEAALTDDDINATYKTMKNLFRNEEDRNLVNYIKVDVVPSEADHAEAIEDVERAMEGLHNLPDLDGIANNLRFSVERHNTSTQYLPAAIAAHIDQLQNEDSVQEVGFYDNKFTIAKYFGSSTAIDKIKIDEIKSLDETKTDSLVALLNSGVPVDSLSSLAIKTATDEEISLLDSRHINFAPIVQDAEEGVFFAPGVDKIGNNSLIYRVSEKQPVEIYNVAEITYLLEPSTQTIQDLREALSDYVDKNSSASAFVNNAAAAGYTVVPTYVTEGSLILGNIPDTGKAARWASDTDNEGSVSQIFSDNASTYFLAVAVSDVYDGDYIPVSDPIVKQRIKPLALQQKKVNMLMKRYEDKGANLEEFAEATGQPIETAAVSFSGEINPLLSPDGTLLGLVAGTPVGKYVGPTATDLSIIAFEKTASTAPAREFNESLDMNRFSSTLGIPPFSTNNRQLILRHGKKIQNKIHKFTGNND